MITATFSLVQQLINMRNLPAFVFRNFDHDSLLTRPQIPHGIYVGDTPRTSVHPDHQLGM